MLSFAIATHSELLIARAGAQWSVERQLQGKSPESLAVDPVDPSLLYAGTWGNGLWRSTDGGRSWEPAGGGLPHAEITAVAVGRWHAAAPGPVFVGTEPSTLSRSADGGRSWEQLEALLELPSASSWSFPPKPETHHVRWIEVDPDQSGKLYLAIEAGALVRTLDSGKSWIDRVPGGPYDTHTAATHPGAKGWIYCAAGDGYFESHDGGESWAHPMDGFRHRYLVGVAVDSADPDSVVVSAASGPSLAYRVGHAEAYVYRKRGPASFEPAMEGLPVAQGTVASRLASDPDEPGVFYAANNHGLFRSQDGGASWKSVEIPWPDGSLSRSVNALAAFPE